MPFHFAVLTGLCPISNLSNTTGFSYSNFGVVSNCVNGGTSVELSTVSFVSFNIVPQQNLDRIFIGSVPTGYVSRFVYIPQKSTPQALQELTR